MRLLRMEIQESKKELQKQAAPQPLPTLPDEVVQALLQAAANPTQGTPATGTAGVTPAIPAALSPRFFFESPNGQKIFVPLSNESGGQFWQCVQEKKTKDGTQYHLECLDDDSDPPVQILIPQGQRLIEITPPESYDENDYSDKFKKFQRLQKLSRGREYVFRYVFHRGRKYYAVPDLGGVTQFYNFKLCHTTRGGTTRHLFEDIATGLWDIFFEADAWKETWSNEVDVNDVADALERRQPDVIPGRPANLNIHKFVYFEQSPSGDTGIVELPVGKKGQVELMRIEAMDEDGQRQYLYVTSLYGQPPSGSGLWELRSEWIRVDETREWKTRKPNYPIRFAGPDGSIPDGPDELQEKVKRNKDLGKLILPD